MERRGLVIAGLWTFVAIGGGAVVAALTIPALQTWHTELLWGGGGLALGCFFGLLAILALLPRESVQAHHAGGDQVTQRDQGVAIQGSNNIVHHGPGSSSVSPAPVPPAGRPKAFVPDNPPGDATLGDVISYLISRSAWGLTPRTEKEALREIKQHAYALAGAASPPKIWGYGALYDATRPRQGISATNWLDAVPVTNANGRIVGIAVGGAEIHDVHLEWDQVQAVWPQRQ